jgi:uncharacterized protein YceH (UPF0502 family)
MSIAYAILPFIFLLACPLMMVGMGAVAWMMARARGQKKDFSMGCMGGQCDHKEHAGQNGVSSLEAQVSDLQREVEVLGSQGSGAATGWDRP